PRIGSDAHFLDEILGVVDGPREPISGPVEELIMPADQRLESVYGRSASGNDGESGHLKTQRRPWLTRSGGDCVPFGSTEKCARLLISAVVRAEPPKKAAEPDDPPARCGTGSYRCRSAS